MDTVTLTKKEYDRLAQKALRYDYLREMIKGDLFACPPVKKEKRSAE